MPREDDEVRDDKNEEIKEKDMNEAEMISNDQNDELEETEMRLRMKWKKIKLVQVTGRMSRVYVLWKMLFLL